MTASYCYDTGADVEIKGNYFRDGKTTAWLIGSDKKEYEMTKMVSVKATVLVANFRAEFLPAGFYTVKIQNGPDCVTYASASITLRVHPKLFALFVDPIIVYAAFVLGATIFPIFVPHFRLCDVVSLRMCVLLYKDRTILEMLPN